MQAGAGGHRGQLSVEKGSCAAGRAQVLTGRNTDCPQTRSEASGDVRGPRARQPDPDTKHPGSGTVKSKASAVGLPDEGVNTRWEWAGSEWEARQQSKQAEKASSSQPAWACGWAGAGEHEPRGALCRSLPL